MKIFKIKIFKMKNIFQLLALILIQCIVSTSMSAQTQPPASLSIQGILKKSNGEAVEDGTQKITFRLYADATGGGALWTEIQNEVEVFSGVYSATLGLITHFDDPSSMVDFSSIYYLGVTVGTSEMTPRIVLTAAPYALSLIGSTNQFPSSGTVLADNLVVTNAITVKNGPPLGSGAGYGFKNDVNTGLYNPVDGEVAIYSDGTKVLKVDQTGVTIKGLQSVAANTGQSIALNTDGSITSTGDIDAGAGDIITTGEVSANNLKLTGGAIDYGNDLKGWRLIDVDNFESSADGWKEYSGVTGQLIGWNDSSSDGTPEVKNWGGFAGKALLPTTNRYVLKKSFTPAGSFTQIKVKFRYHFIDSWDGYGSDRGFAAFATNAGASGFHVGWQSDPIYLHANNTPFDNTTFKTSANYAVLSSFPDHWNDVEMTGSKDGTTFWVFIGASMAQDAGETYAVSNVEIWVR
jgi:hypothetical protein